MLERTAAQATLSSKGDYSIFTSGDHVIRFRTSPQLERYTRVKEWDQGYLVVMAKYRQAQQEEEEYIDLVPILKNLYFDAVRFLRPIRKVEINYE